MKPAQVIRAGFVASRTGRSARCEVAISARAQERRQTMANAQS